MKDERWIEELFDKAEAPGLRIGLKSQVLENAFSRLEENRVGSVPRWAAWALAASLLVGLGFQWAAKLREAGHRQSVMASWGRTEGIPCSQILEEYEMPLRLAMGQRRASRPSVEDLARRMAIYKMMEGESNGS